MFLLDTNVCVRFLNARSTSIVQRLQTLEYSEVAVCSIVKAELRYGALRSQHSAIIMRNQDRFLEPYQSFPFDDDAALEAGRLRALLADKGTPIGLYDVMIGAIALVNDLTLVTHNVGEFGRIPNLKIDDWESA